MTRGRKPPLGAEAFTAVADFAPGMMWLSKSDGGRTFFNRTWLSFTGRSVDEESGVGWARGVHADDRARCLAAYHKGVHSGQRFELEYRLRRADGEYRHVLDCAAPHGTKGGLAGFIGSCLDITERKTAELLLRARETQLRESERQLRRLASSVEQARENERTMIARELHDELGQSLTAIKLELARTARVLTRQRLEPEALDSLQSIVGGIDVATETVRRLATSLRPPALDHLGLVAAIELEAAALTRRTGIRSRIFGNRRVPPLAPLQTTGTFRIVQEALTNVTRHASASAVTIWIVGRAKSTLIKIQDNGRGMTVRGPTDRAALGLLGMHERAEMIGGTLTIRSTPGKGTTISLMLKRPAAARGKRRA
jgi:PAS domain S-box-containing protein